MRGAGGAPPPPVLQQRQQQQQFGPSSSSSSSPSSNPPYVDASLLLSSISSLSSRVVTTENDLSSLSRSLSSLSSSQSSVVVKLSSLPTFEQLHEVKKGVDVSSVVSAKASKNADEALKQVSRLSVQLYEVELLAKDNVDLSKEVDYQKEVTSSLARTVEELKGERSLLATLDKELSSVRRDLHGKQSDDATFRDGTNKKSVVLFNELVRLSELQDKDRGNAKAEGKELGSLLTTNDKRIRALEEGYERLSRTTSTRSERSEGLLASLSAKVESLEREVGKSAVTNGEEQRRRKNGDETLGAMVSELRQNVFERLADVGGAVDVKVVAFQEQMRALMEGAKVDVERGRKIAAEELRGVSRELAAEQMARGIMAADLSKRIATLADEGRIDALDSRQAFQEQLNEIKSEQGSIVGATIKSQEDAKKGIADLQNAVVEMQVSANAKIERTRAALEEVVRAEIQSRQNNVSSLEGRVRDIIGDCMASLDAVSYEGRMAVDAIANRVNALEFSMTKTLEAKVSTVEEAVAARQFEQDGVNLSIKATIESIKEKEGEEHKHRIEKEKEIISQVVTVKEKVEEEIGGVKKIVDDVRTTTATRLNDMNDDFGYRIDTTKSQVRELQTLSNKNETTLEQLVVTSASNFEAVRSDAVKTRGHLKVLGEHIVDVDGKVTVSAVVSSSAGLVASVLERDASETKERETRSFFEQYVKESEAKLVAKELEREKSMTDMFQRQLQALKEEHKQQLDSVKEQLKNQMSKEREEEMKREEEIKSSFARALDAVTAQASSQVAAAAAAGKAAEEEISKRAEEEKAASKKRHDEFKEELRLERNRNGLLGKKLEELANAVAEREVVEESEWKQILTETGGGSNDAPSPSKKKGAGSDLAFKPAVSAAALSAGMFP